MRLRGLSVWMCVSKLTPNGNHSGKQVESEADLRKSLGLHEFCDGDCHIMLPQPCHRTVHSYGQIF